MPYFSDTAQLLPWWYPHFRDDEILQVPIRPRGPDPRWMHGERGALEPNPSPWDVAQYLVRQVSLRNAARHADRKELVAGIDTALTKFMDGCGTEPHHWPFPPRPIGPYPPDEPLPIVYAVVAEIGLIASGLQDGDLKRDLAEMQKTLLIKARA